MNNFKPLSLGKALVVASNNYKKPAIKKDIPDATV